MMSNTFTRFFSRSLNQVAVYWGSPSPDGRGGKTFGEPVERMCRWEEADEIVRAPDGRDIVCKVRVYLTQEVSEGGWMYLGTLDDLDSNPGNPRELDGACEIISIRKIPAHKSIEDYIYRASLNIEGA